MFRILNLILNRLLLGDHNLLPLIPPNLIQPNMLPLEHRIHILLIELNPHNRIRMLQHRIEYHAGRIPLHIMLIQILHNPRLGSITQ